jgi:hypothetical protein
MFTCNSVGGAPLLRRLHQHDIIHRARELCKQLEDIAHTIVHGWFFC